MRVVVTGGSGQLGTVLVRRLLLDRAIEKVVVLDVRPPIVASRKVEFLRADVRDPGIARHLEGAAAVFHLAFLVTQAAEPGVFEAVNVEGSKNVLRAAAAAGASSVVYASSIAAHGVVPGHPVPIVEGTPRRRQAELPYAAAKFDVEAFLDELEPSHPEVAFCRLRPVILAGRRMEHSLGSALRAGLVPDLGDPSVPMVWDEDVAQAAVLAMKQRARGAFLLAADDPLPAAEIAAAAGLRRVPVPRGALRRGVGLARRLGLGMREDPAWLELEPMDLRVSSRRAREELGWKPRHPTGRDVARALGAAAHGRPDPRIAVFLRLSALGFEDAAAERPEAKRLSGTIHLELLGPGGGDHTLVLGGGRLSVAAGAPRPPASVLTLAASTFTDLLAGRASMSTVRLTGKVRLEGEPIAMVVLSALVTGFREQARSPELRALPARLLGRWLGDPGAGARGSS